MPVIADADTGYGNALNVRRTIREFERAGVAALHLEDQTFPKRCGHLDDKTVVPRGEMVQKLRAARDAASDADLVLIARTDAIAVEGLEAAIERALAYAEAGADVIFVEAPTSEAQIETIARRVSTPKLLNMFEGGKTPLVPLDRLSALGYRIVIIPSDLQRAAIRAMQDVLTAIRARRQQSCAGRSHGDVHRARGHRRHRRLPDARSGGFSMTMPRIGFVGLGAMGGAMAGYLVKSGYAVTGYDVSAARAEAAALAGVTLAASPAEAAAVRGRRDVEPAHSGRGARRLSR